MDASRQESLTVNEAAAQVPLFTLYLAPPAVRILSPCTSQERYPCLSVLMQDAKNAKNDHVQGHLCVALPCTLLNRGREVGGSKYKAFDEM